MLIVIICRILYYNMHMYTRELGQLSWYSGELQAGWLESASRQGQKIFLFSTASMPASGLTQPPNQLVPGLFFHRYSRRGMKLSTQLHLVPRSRIVDLYRQYIFVA
jgi:hypothetical protein